MTISPAIPEVAPTEGPRILVKGFRIKGAILVSEDEILAALQPVVGKELTLGQLRQVAATISILYLEKGYIARAILPPQEIVDGIVEIQVIEGRRGSLRIDSNSDRIPSGLVQGFVDHRVAEGGPMDVRQLGEALTILNEQPGVSVKASLLPGKGEGEVDIAVDAAEQSLVSYDLGLNNYGSYSTGKAQVSGSIKANNPTGRFDAASAFFNLSDGSKYIVADYSLAVGVSGLRLGASASHLNYDVTEPSLAALNASGDATTAGLKASYPVFRRTFYYLSLTGDYQYSALQDRTVAGETGDRHVQTLKLGVDGFVVTGLLGGSIVNFGAGFTVGNTDQRNAAALATDAATRRAQGDFAKLGYNLSWLGSLPQDLTLNASLRGQLASKNLDSLEQFSLGGPNGVRAYPVGEASGDDGWLLSLNLGKQFSGVLSAQLFYDVGHVRLNHATWTNWNAANPNLQNAYSLHGVGVGMEWRVHRSVLISASLAKPLGNNPGADINGHDVEGKDSQTRLWAGLSGTF